MMNGIDEETGLVCADCGLEVLDASERVFVFGDDRVLCPACAVARGGAYDDATERWVVPPDLSGLGADAEHRVFRRESV